MLRDPLTHLCAGSPVELAANLPIEPESPPTKPRSVGRFLFGALGKRAGGETRKARLGWPPRMAPQSMNTNTRSFTFVFVGPVTIRSPKALR